MVGVAGGCPDDVNRHLGDEKGASALRIAHGTYRHLALFDLPWEIEIGLRLAFYHTLAIPRIARLLAQSGETRERPLKRGVDTALLMYELIDSGTDSPAGREVIRALKGIHRRWQIEPEDYQYVLATFIVVPVRFADRYGWRPVSGTEREAACIFYGDRLRQPRHPGLSSVRQRSRALDCPLQAARRIGIGTR